jgi:hypothetical protein
MVIKFLNEHRECTKADDELTLRIIEAGDYSEKMVTKLMRINARLCKRMIAKHGSIPEDDIFLMYWKAWVYFLDRVDFAKINSIKSVNSAICQKMDWLAHSHYRDKKRRKEADEKSSIAYISIVSESGVDREREKQEAEELYKKLSHDRSVKIAKAVQIEMF